VDAEHSVGHLIISVGLLAGSLAFTLVVRNRAIRRRLLFSAAAAATAALVHLLATFGVEGWLQWPEGWRVERLFGLLAFGNAAVALVFNPWYKDGESDRAPAIVQDSLVIVVAIVGGVLLFHVSSFNFLTGSAIVAAVVGFALQETLGNAFAGIAIQIERPFRVGDRVAIGEHTGVVTEVTWRSTNVRSLAGNVTTVPNSMVAREVIINYSEPSSPTRLEVEVGAAYGTPPNVVREALLSAMRGANHVLESPAADVMLAEFSASAITYRARFWVGDFAIREHAKDAVRTRIYYEFKRRGIEIPWPIQVEYHRHDVPADSPARRDAFVRAIAGVPVFAPLPPDAHRALASEARELLFAGGETIVHEGQGGGSMFLVLAGRVAITTAGSTQPVAVTSAGGYFGEISLLTGEPRTATVVAMGDCTVLEIGAGAFRAYVQRQPDVIDDLAAAASARRRELTDARAAGGGPPAAAIASLRERMSAFFGLDRR